MKTIQFNCPNCQQHFEAGEATAAQPVLCPNCQTTFLSPTSLPPSVWATPAGDAQKKASEAAEALERTSQTALWTARFIFAAGVLIGAALFQNGEEGRAVSIFSGAVALAVMFGFSARLAGIHAAILRLRK